VAKIINNALLREQQDLPTVLEDNNVPPSCYITDKIIEVEDSARLRYHVC